MVLISDKRNKERISEVLCNKTPISVKEYYSLKNHAKSLEGVYVLHNVDDDKYYVGQSSNVWNRVDQHFSCKGNDGVYYDYVVNEAEFTILLIPFDNSRFTSLNEMERVFIAHYNAYSRGYNKTRGNK